MTEQQFKDEVLQYADKYPPDLLERFIIYWTEPFVKGRKKGLMRFEGENTWRLSGRLATFYMNQKQWHGVNKGKFDQLRDYANRHN